MSKLDKEIKEEIEENEHDPSPKGIGKFVIGISLVIGLVFIIMLFIFNYYHTPIIQK